jgi:GNAT superfamily N-acetyltransferase
MTAAERELLRRWIREGKLRPSIRVADVADKDAILDLIEEAKQWLPTKGTTQWSSDWKDGGGLGRGERVAHSLKDGTTWLVYVPFRAGELALGTVTIEDNSDSRVWSDRPSGTRRCAYLSRLVTARDFAGLDIGTAVIDWACRWASQEYDARHIRIDVWTDNYELHKYYRKHGFRPRGLCLDESYPSRARFERRTGRRTWRRVPRIQRT